MVPEPQEYVKIRDLGLLSYLPLGPGKGLKRLTVLPAHLQVDLKSHEPPSALGSS